MLDTINQQVLIPKSKADFELKKELNDILKKANQDPNTLKGLVDTCVHKYREQPGNTKYKVHVLREYEGLSQQYIERESYKVRQNNGILEKAPQAEEKKEGAPLSNVPAAQPQHVAQNLYLSELLGALNIQDQAISNDSLINQMMQCNKKKNSKAMIFLLERSSTSPLVTTFLQVFASTEVGKAHINGLKQNPEIEKKLQTLNWEGIIAANSNQQPDVAVGI
jgi:hypothetical protein